MGVAAIQLFKPLVSRRKTPPWTWTPVLLALVLCSPALAARVPLLIDATAVTFHWSADYARGLSP